MFKCFNCSWVGEFTSTQLSWQQDEFYSILPICPICQGNLKEHTPSPQPTSDFPKDPLLERIKKEVQGTSFIAFEAAGKDLMGENNSKLVARCGGLQYVEAFPLIGKLALMILAELRGE